MRRRSRNALDRFALDLDEHAERVVETKPHSDSSVASPYTNGRNPTPCTSARDPRADPHSSSSSVWYALACASWMRGMCSERTTITWSASASAAIRPPS